MDVLVVEYKKKLAKALQEGLEADPIQCNSPTPEKTATTWLRLVLST
jgi:hypothetical protein